MKTNTPIPDTATKKSEKIDEDVVVDYISFECNGYSGLYFNAGDIEYLSAKFYIKPFYNRKHIKVRTQIFLEGEPFTLKQ